MYVYMHIFVCMYYVTSYQMECTFTSCMLLNFDNT